MAINFIKNLQKKSRQERQKVLWIFVFVVFLSIFVTWIILVPRTYFVKKEETNINFSKLKGELMSELNLDLENSSLQENELFKEQTEETLGQIENDDDLKTISEIPRLPLEKD